MQPSIEPSAARKHDCAQRPTLNRSVGQNHSMKLMLIVGSCLLLVLGCGLFDSGVEWRSGRYALIWIDLPEEVGLSYDEGHGSWVELVEPRVFAVGSNEQYVVAKQHPLGDKSITNFFIVAVSAGSMATSDHGIAGPLSEQEYQGKAALLPLPPFTKTLDSLR